MTKCSTKLQNIRGKKRYHEKGTFSTTTGVSRASSRIICLIAQSNLVRKLVGKGFFRFLSQSVLCDCLERLFNVDSLFSRSFEIGDVVFAHTPLLGSFSGYLNSVKIDCKLKIIAFPCGSTSCTLLATSYF